MSGIIDHAQHTAYSDPGRHLDLVTAVPADPDGLSAIARNLIVHYRASGEELPASSREDIHLRWLASLLEVDQARHPVALREPREVTARVQGCCRDHTLFGVGVLRSHGIPARSRVGFAGYFVDGWHHDHLVVEAWLNGRWRRFDPEVESPRPTLPQPTDIGHCAVQSTGFVTAAQAWAGYRSGEIDPYTYGVDPFVPMLRGPRFLFDEVIQEVSHRFGEELLLWDVWGRMGEPEDKVGESEARWLDEISALLLEADRGDMQAEQDLLDRYRADADLHPGATVLQVSPYGDPPVVVELGTPPHRGGPRA